MSGRCQTGTPTKGIRPRPGHSPHWGSATLDLSQIVPYLLAHALTIGPALLGAGILVRAFGKTLARLVFSGGVLAAGALAYGQWQITHSPVISGAILLGAVLLFGALAWAIRGVSTIIAFGLLAGAFYLILYGWMGPSFANSSIGSLTWVGAAIVTEIAAGFRTGWLRHAPLAAAGLAVLR